MRQCMECIDCKCCIKTDEMCGTTPKLKSIYKNHKNNWPVDNYCEEKHIPIYMNMATQCKMYEKKEIAV